MQDQGREGCRKGLCCPACDCNDRSRGRGQTMEGDCTWQRGDPQNKDSKLRPVEKETNESMPAKLQYPFFPLLAFCSSPPRNTYFSL